MRRSQHAPSRRGPAYRLFSLLCAIVLILGASGVVLAQESVEKVSKHNFQQTVRKLGQAMKSARLLILGEFDYQKMQRMVGKSIKPAKGFNFFRPDLGTPIFANDPNAALEVPLKIIVLDKGDKVVVRYRKPSDTFSQYKGLSNLGKQLDALVEQLATAATK